MATGQTTGHNLPYPLSTDPVNVHGDIKALADRLEIVISAISSLPSQTGNAGKYLKTDGYVTSWESITVPTVSEATPTTAGIVYGTTNTSNVAIGAPTLGDVTLGSVTTGNSNVGVGPRALAILTTALTNTAVGYGALRSSNGNANTGIGSSAGSSVTTGQTNTFIGMSSGYGVTTGSNNICIGASSQPSSATASNEISIGTYTNNRFTIPGMKIDWNHVLSEHISVFLGAPPATIDHDVTFHRSIRYHTVNATNNWVFNIRGDSTTTYDSISVNARSTTFVFIATNGATAYYPTAFQIDGVAQTVKWQGGSAPSGGNANSIDVYTYTVIKTAANTYTVLGSQTKFA